MSWEDYKNREDRLGGETPWDIYLAILVLALVAAVFVTEVVIKTT